ncbi:MAG: c-type cytochrome [Dokdonella sp.]
MKRRTEHMMTVVIVLILIVLGYGVFAWSGLYNIGADDPHWRLTYAMMETVRDRSIHVRSKDIVVPPLDDPQLILKGAGQYAAMCTGCHLKPGMKDSEIRPGLYPQPPNLSQVHVDPQDAFWVIKHGIKMSAMPAWGFSHDDDTIWSMVAFIQKLPGLTPAQYEEIVAKAPPDEDMDMDMGDGGHKHTHTHNQVDSDAGQAAPAAQLSLSMDGLTPNGVPDAEAAARAFHTALQTGDRAGVLALLAPEVTVSEGGETQSRDEYAGHHLAEDIAFLKTATITPISLASMAMGATAMVGSESTVLVVGKPAFNSREMLTLKHDGANWKIVSIQWQSGAAK